MIDTWHWNLEIAFSNPGWSQLTLSFVNNIPTMSKQKISITSQQQTVGDFCHDARDLRHPAICSCEMLLFQEENDTSIGNGLSQTPRARDRTGSCFLTDLFQHWLRSDPEKHYLSERCLGGKNYNETFFIR